MKTSSGFDDLVDIQGIIKDDPLRYVGDAKHSGSFFYGFALMHDTRVKEEHFLFPNPQSISYSEPAATSIVALQGGGKYIERRGSIFKDITVGGTTGYMPNQRAAGHREFEQRFRFVSDDEAAKRMVVSSGFNEFHELRNFFRKYQNIMRAGKRDDVKKTYMVWLNYKDDEYFIVEPIDFRTTRDKSKPLSYDYQIQLRYIDNADSYVPFKLELTKLKGLAGFVKGALAAIATFERIATAIRAIINEVIDLVKSVMNRVLGLISTINGALRNFAGAVTDVVNLPVTIMKSHAAALKDILSTALAVGQAFSTEVIGAVTDGIQTCNNLAAETKMFRPTFEKAWNAKLASFTSASNTALRGEAFDKVSPTAQSAVTEELILPGETIQMISARLLGDATRFIELIIMNNLSAPYLSPRPAERLPNTLCPGDYIQIPETPGNERQPNNTSIHEKQSESAPSVTSQAASGSTALILVGDPTRLVHPWRLDQWKGFICVFLAGTGAGQQALIASNTANPTLTFQSPVAIPPDSTTIYSIRVAGQQIAPSGAEQSLGIDVALTEDYDLAKTASGDLRTSKGFENMDQAIGIKFRTEQGTLIAHNFFGIAPATGNKANGANLSQHRLNARRTLLSDARIARISRLGFTARKDVVEVVGEVELKFSGITRTVSGHV